MIFKITLQTFQVGLNNVKNEEIFNVFVPFSNQKQIVSIDCQKETLFAALMDRKKNIRSSVSSS